MNVRMAIWRAFAALGLDVRRRRSLDQEGPPRGSMAGAFRQLARLGLAPNTVIDVGAAPAPQTQELYDVFPRAAMLLIEPLVEFEPALRKICATYNAQYVFVREDGAFRRSHAYATAKQREVIDHEMARGISAMQGNQV